MKVIITNKIEQKVLEYQERTGATKKWVADKVGISSQHLYKTFHSKNINLEMLIKISVVLNCNVTDLFDYEVIS